ncbi:MAG: hypothetical protein HXS54_17325 [Theionarchaea archaeon]|nr:hypothetical protein [Theionarchaea archaeon]
MVIEDERFLDIYAVCFTIFYQSVILKIIRGYLPVPYTCTTVIEDVVVVFRMTFS